MLFHFSFPFHDSVPLIPTEHMVNTYLVATEVLTEPMLYTKLHSYIPIAAVTHPTVKEVTSYIEES